MSLSVCVTPDHESEAVERLRPLATEIVVADWTQDADAARDRCSGDWILWLEEHEVPSHAFVARLPELLARRDVQQFCIARAWLYPDMAHRLIDTPWSLDFPNALVRREAPPRLPGLLHAYVEMQRPFEYVEEPLNCLALIAGDEAARRDEAVVREAVSPQLLAPGGGRLAEAFLLPELRHGLTISALSDDPAAQNLSLQPSTYRKVLVRLANHGTETWPCELDHEPPIRVGHRWTPNDREGKAIDGPRTPFPHPVAPGESVLAAADVVAPSRAGQWTLEVDAVHEFVQWFDCGVALDVQVDASHPLPPTGERLVPSPSPRGRRLRRMRLPRVIHRVWLGSRPMPSRDVAWGATFELHHPGWEMRLWADEDLAALSITAEDRHRARSPAELSNLVRYEVLHRHGGVYVDTDMECLRPLDPLLRGIDGFAALELPGRAGQAILGSVPGHLVFARAARSARRTLGRGPDSVSANGEYFFSLILEQEPGFAIFEASLMYPFRWDEPEIEPKHLPEALTIHHWNQSWPADEGVGGAAPVNRA